MSSSSSSSSSSKVEAVETPVEEVEKKPVVLTREKYLDAMEKMKVIEDELSQMMGKRCKLMDMLDLEKVQKMRKVAEEYKEKHPNWAE